MLLTLLALLACKDAQKPPGALIFVRGGVIVEGGMPIEGARALPGGRALVARLWRSGETVELGGLGAQAPSRAECVPFAHAPLGDVSRLIAAGGSPPDTSLAFSPDGRLLAVGSYLGELLVLDAWTGEVLRRKTVPEALIKRVAWSPDGRTLYAAEQSPDAMIWALDAVSLKPRWSRRLADDVGSSPAPAGVDLFGVYSLPTAYGLEVLPGGDLLVAASHGWNDEGGARLNRSRVLRLSPDGELVAGFPETAADGIFLHPQLDLEGGLVALSVTRSASGDAPPGLPYGGMIVLDLVDLSPVAQVRAEPLAPHFESVFVWEASAVSREHDLIVLGLGDGRVLLRRLDGGERATLSAGAPVMAGEVPISASVGHALIHGGDVVYLTSRTTIPWGAAAPELRPPTAHPNENALWVVSPDGETRWTWTGPQALDGVSLAADGRHLLVGAGVRDADRREDLFGALVFDLGGDAGRGGEERLEAFCATASPIFFRPVMSVDGRVAVAEHPTPDGQGGVKGEYRVTILR
ncbi:hypothetical protein L6R49_04995 [Myxococcota bacterium]|nr:hypothetical protein [Myxococcota bacterium]